MKNIYEQAIEKNIPLSNHQSDLYLMVTPESREIVNGYEHKQNVSIFRSQIDGKDWYDIPFAYSPFWEKRVQK